MTYAEQVIADGAVAFWRLGETSGTTAVDNVGGNNGTISGGVTLNQPGPWSGNAAMAFDGTTGKISTAATMTIPIAGTVEVWMITTQPGQITAFSQQVAGQFAIGVLNSRWYIYSGEGGIK